MVEQRLILSLLAFWKWIYCFLPKNVIEGVEANRVDVHGITGVDRVLNRLMYIISAVTQRSVTLLYFLLPDRVTQVL